MNPTRAALTDNVYGWAWGDHTGWISFNCLNDNSCAGSNYGVKIWGDGRIEGYAWSDIYGWIWMNPPDGYPGAPSYSTKLDIPTGQLSGWARICSLADDPGSCAGPNGQGWIKWRKDPADPGVNYGVTLDTAGYFRGWAWGADEVGWISLSCTTGGEYGGYICDTSAYQARRDLGQTAINAVATTTDGNYIGVGKINAPNGMQNRGDDIYVVKFDPTGNVIWAKAAGGTGDEAALAVVQFDGPTDDGVVMTGYTYSYGNGGQLFVSKWLNNGTVSTNKTVGGALTDVGRSIFQADNGDFIVTGSTDSYGAADYDGWILRFDALLDLQNPVARITGSSIDNAYGAVIADNGDIITVGDSRSFGAADADIFLTGLAGDLSALKWTRRIGAAGADDFGRAIIRAEADIERYLISGETAGYGQGGQDAYIFQVTAEGLCGGCAALTDNPAGLSLSNHTLIANNISLGVLNINPSVTALATPFQTVMDADVAVVCGHSYMMADVTTNDATGIGETVARLNGVLTDDGGNEADWFGFDYGTDPLALDQSAGSAGSRGAPPPDIAFFEDLAGLTPLTPYYFRAKVHTAAGWSYGEVKLFTTAAVPVVLTVSAGNIGNNQATLYGFIQSSGGSNITDRKFQYKKNIDASWLDSAVDSGADLPLGDYSIIAGGLDQNTLYDYRAAARNSGGWGYGLILQFTTLGINADPGLQATNTGSNYNVCTTPCPGTCPPTGEACTGACTGGVAQPACYNGLAAPTISWTVEKIMSGSFPAQFDEAYFWLEADAAAPPWLSADADYKTGWLATTSGLVDFKNVYVAGPIPPSYLLPERTYNWRVSVLDGGGSDREDGIRDRRNSLCSNIRYFKLGNKVGSQALRFKRNI